MGRRRWSRFALTSVLLISLFAGSPAFTQISSNFCRWCDDSSPLCDGNVCLSNCNFSSFCNLAEEICVAIWKKDNVSMTVRTLCHHPQQVIENIVLGNYSSSECLMAPQAAEDGLVYVCGCVGLHDCNDKLVFDKGANGFSKIQSKDVIPVVVISLVPPFVVAVFATIAFYFYRTRQPSKQRKDWAPKRTHYQSLDPAEGRSEEANSSGYHGKLSSKTDEVHSDMSSTHIRDHKIKQLPIQLEALVGKGRFAEVWRARLNHSEGGQYDTVAVKIFPAMEFASWQNERAIFSDANLKHENVVEFLSAEERGGVAGPPQRQYWLIMAYHSMGNLQDFLANHVLSWGELCAQAGSVARGVAHLHSDTTDSGAAKVPIAHRDLKSSNIVVKNRYECALCDFGLALQLDLSLSVDDYANSGQVGTARYMAPEVLESRVNLEDLESFKQMDVYSMALVLWEMSSRCDVIGEVKSYEPPFGSKVCDPPCVDSMRDLVLRDRGRPDIPPSWTTHQGMELLCSTITECWDHDPEARLTAHCVVERFNTLTQPEDSSVVSHIAEQHSSLATPTPPSPSSGRGTDASLPPSSVSETQVAEPSDQPTEV
ncbi:TGF-beta receptor type-2 [Denticeps clupeoides]|uniref:Serine/threonine-protein kinase receptor n=1 Tax=Denticeps clupeoides TaxID=299321 RepID=A0AAY4E0G3_9TELE|nr:TGF-beta receptor type-2-like [Denticeps clupeoides]